MLWDKAIDLLRWSLREGQLKPGDDDECLRERHEDDRSLNPHVNAVWSRLVDVVLQHTSVSHGDGDEEKAGEDPGDGVKVDL